MYSIKMDFFHNFPELPPLMNPIPLHTPTFKRHSQANLPPSLLWASPKTRVIPSFTFEFLSLNKPIGASPRRDYVLTRMVLLYKYNLVLYYGTEWYIEKGGERPSGYGWKEIFILRKPYWSSIVLPTTQFQYKVSYLFKHHTRLPTSNKRNAWALIFLPLVSLEHSTWPQGFLQTQLAVRKLLPW